MSLVDQARERKARYRIDGPTAEELEVVVAYYNGELTTSQASFALSLEKSSPTALSGALRGAATAGYVKVEIVYTSDG